MTHMCNQLMWICGMRRVYYNSCRNLPTTVLEYKQQEQQLMLCISHARTPQPHRTSHTAPHGAGCGESGLGGGDCARTI